jgi:methionyl aminopeptidase
MNDIDAQTRRTPGKIKLHGHDAFAGMRKAGRLVAECLDMCAAIVRPGVARNAIDQAVFKFAMDHGVMPATLQYKGYEYSCCTSVNDVVCHGFPDDKILKEGDIVNIDVTLIVDGWHGDSSRMYLVGEVKPFASRLVDVTFEALRRGVAAIRPGGHFGDIGYAIQSYAEGERCSVVRDFCGHGVGRLFHDEPNVLHYGRRGEGPRLEPGMIFTVEPMINLGRPHVRIKPDGWTAVTKDKSLSAQFEHTVGVTTTGCEIFTSSPNGLDNPAHPERPSHG